MIRVDKVVEYKKANVSAARVAIPSTDTAITTNATKRLKVADSISVHKARVITTGCAFKLRRNRDISVDARELDITDLDAKQNVTVRMRSRKYRLNVSLSNCNRFIFIFKFYKQSYIISFTFLCF